MVDFIHAMIDTRVMSRSVLFVESLTIDTLFLPVTVVIYPLASNKMCALTCVRTILVYRKLSFFYFTVLISPENIFLVLKILCTFGLCIHMIFL